jgi:hypothetical protein
MQLFYTVDSRCFYIINGDYIAAVKLVG